MWYEYACWRYRQRASRHMLKHSNLDGGARERHQKTHVKYSYPDTEVREDDLNPQGRFPHCYMHRGYADTCETYLDRGST